MQDRVQTSDHWITHAQGRLFARQWRPLDTTEPTAAPIVMLHDSLGSVDLWRGFPELLCALTGRAVIAYDRLGFGHSDARTELPSVHFVAEEASVYFPALREQLGLQRFVALGHSVGGGMAIEIAARFPEACEALVTIAAQVFAEDRTLNGIRTAKAQFEAPGQMDRLLKYHGTKADWVLHAWTENWLSPAFADWHLKAVLPEVTCPVLALHGALDEYGSAIHPTLIGELSSGPAQVELLDGMGHVPQREQPGHIAHLVAMFLSQLA